MNAGVAAVDLSKIYRTTAALSKLSFAVAPGSIYGLIGPNGAGKTTTLTILAGLVQPTSGSAWVLGQQVVAGNGRLAGRVGFCSPQFPYFDYLTGSEILLTCGLMHGLASQVAKRRMHDLLELLDLESCAGQFVHQYSQGMRLKLGLACALIHAPAVLLLDEPFIGLDPTCVYRLVSTLRRMADGGRTIVLSSHDMALVERLCNRVGVLHKGSLQREIAPACSSGATANQPGKWTPSRLESILWEIVGKPEIKELTWI